MSSFLRHVTEDHHLKLFTTEHHFSCVVPVTGLGASGMFGCC